MHSCCFFLPPGNGIIKRIPMLAWTDWGFTCVWNTSQSLPKLYEPPGYDLYLEWVLEGSEMIPLISGLPWGVSAIPRGMTKLSFRSQNFHIYSHAMDQASIAMTKTWIKKLVGSSRRSKVEKPSCPAALRPRMAWGDGWPDSTQHPVPLPWHLWRQLKCDQVTFCELMDSKEYNPEKFTTISWHSNFLTVLYAEKSCKESRWFPSWKEHAQANLISVQVVPSAGQTNPHSGNLSSWQQSPGIWQQSPHCQQARTTPWAIPKNRGKKDADMPLLALACTSYSLIVPFQVQPLLMQTAGRLSTSRRAALSGKAWNGKNKQAKNTTEGLQFWSGLRIISVNSSQTSCPINPQRCVNNNQIALTLSRAPPHTRDLDFSTKESNTVTTLLTGEEKGS